MTVVQINHYPDTKGSKKLDHLEPYGISYTRIIRAYDGSI